MWITFVPFIFVAILVLTGLFLLIKGLVGRRIEHAPKCRKCRYDLTGRVSERCPECGRLVAEVGTINWHRQRRWPLILIGLGLAGPWLALIPISERFDEYLDGYGYKPTAWVLADMRSPNLRLAEHAYWEMHRRLRKDKVADEHIQLLKQQILSDLNGTEPADMLKSSVIGELLAKGHFSTAEAGKLLEPCVSIEMQARQTALQRVGIPIRLHYTGSLPAHWVHPMGPLLQITEPDDTTTIPAHPKNQQLHYLSNGELRTLDELKTAAHAFVSPRHGGNFGWEHKFLVKVPQTGDYPLSFAIRFDFIAGYRSTQRVAYTMVRRFALKSKVLEEPPPEEMKFLHDETTIKIRYSSID